MFVRDGRRDDVHNFDVDKYSVNSDCVDDGDRVGSRAMIRAVT